MIKLTKLFLIFSLFLLFPDTPVVADMSLKKVAKKTKVYYNEDKGTLDLRGPKIKSLKHDPYYISTLTDVDARRLDLYFLTVEYDFIKSNPRKSGYVVSAESAFQNFFTAQDDEGNTFELTILRRELGSCNDSFCNFDEYFRIKIPGKYFRDHKTTGFTLKAISKAGTYIDLYLYPAYIQGTLSRLEQERKKLGY